MSLSSVFQALHPPSYERRAWPGAPAGDGTSFRMSCCLSFSHLVPLSEVGVGA